MSILLITVVCLHALLVYEYTVNYGSLLACPLVYEYTVNYGSLLACTLVYEYTVNYGSLLACPLVYEYTVNYGSLLACPLVYEYTVNYGSLLACTLVYEQGFIQRGGALGYPSQGPVFPPPRISYHNVIMNQIENCTSINAYRHLATTQNASESTSENVKIKNFLGARPP